MDYMIFFDPYTDEVKNNVLDDLKKGLEGVIVLISNEDSDDDGYLSDNPVEVCIGDDDTSSTSKDAAGTSSPGDLHKRVAAFEEVVLDIAAYIREKRLKKKEQDERQHEQVNMSWAGEEKEEEKKDEEEDMCQEESPKEVVASEAEEEAEKQATVDIEKKGEEAPAEESPKQAAAEAEEEPEKETAAEVEKKKEEGEEAPVEEVPAVVDVEIEGEESDHEEVSEAAEKKRAEADQKDLVMDIVGEINSNICVDEEDREKDI
ncbi:cytochrome c1-like [Capsicum annuum]